MENSFFRNKEKRVNSVTSKHCEKPRNTGVFGSTNRTKNMGSSTLG